MPLVERVDVAGAPIAVGDRTVIPVARLHRLALRAGPAAVVGVRARPLHLEVLEPDGRRHDVRVPDVERALRRTLAMLFTLALFIARRRRARPEGVRR